MRNVWPIICTSCLPNVWSFLWNPRMNYGGSQVIPYFKGFSSECVLYYVNYYTAMCRLKIMMLVTAAFELRFYHYSRVPLMRNKSLAPSIHTHCANERYRLGSLSSYIILVTAELIIYKALGEDKHMYPCEWVAILFYLT